MIDSKHREIVVSVAVNEKQYECRKWHVYGFYEKQSEEQESSIRRYNEENEPVLSTGEPGSGNIGSGIKGRADTHQLKASRNTKERYNYKDEDRSRKTKKINLCDARLSIPDSEEWTLEWVEIKRRMGINIDSFKTDNNNGENDWEVYFPTETSRISRVVMQVDTVKEIKNKNGLNEYARLRIKTDIKLESVYGGQAAINKIIDLMKSLATIGIKGGMN